VKWLTEYVFTPNEFFSKWRSIVNYCQDRSGCWKMGGGFRMLWEERCFAIEIE